ncbi:MAG: Bax inhibitor-1/YccA family protein [Eubacterium sp.]|nr:Bax inhibitor-1/YccA family protein [Eubacterium sp.]
MADNYDPNQNLNQGYGGNYPQQYGQNGQYNQDPQQMYQQQMYQQQMSQAMYNNQPSFAPGQQGYGNSAYGNPAVDIQKVLVRSFVFMFIALLVSGITALAVATSWSEGGALGRLIYGSRWGFMIFIIAEFALVIACNVMIKKNNLVASAILFFAYSVVNGLTLSVIFLAYTTGSITQVFFIAAGIFGVMALVGATTKIDLTKLGPILVIGLFGIIIASVINMFIGSNGLTMAISAIGVVIFTGLTAYDVQKIKKIAATNAGYDLNVIGLYGAMELYLDFINLFLYLLRLFGKSK